MIDIQVMKGLITPELLEERFIYEGKTFVSKISRAKLNEPILSFEY